MNVMSWQAQLSEKLTALSQTEFHYIESGDVGRSSEIDFGCSGIYMEATVIYFEIKNFEYLLKENGRRKLAQVYTMFHTVLNSITEQTGGFVNCFSPGALLAVYPGKEEINSHAVRCALKMAYAITHDFKTQFEIIPGLEFAIGMDHGHIMGTKNISDNRYEFLSWFGSCIYKAKRICSQCARPYHVGISSILYHNLSEDLISKKKSILGITKKVDIWTKVTYQHENVKKHLYQTNHKLSLDEEGQ